MSNVRMPIETIREGNKITKICVDDIYKIVNRVQDAMLKAHDETLDIIESIHKEYEDYSGELIIGTGVSQPCLTDAFDEEIGNDIAFMKAKLNANIKKHKLLVRIYNKFLQFKFTMLEEIAKIDNNIDKDLNRLRVHNPDYLDGIEEELELV